MLAILQRSPCIRQRQANLVILATEEIQRETAHYRGHAKQAMASTHARTPAHTLTGFVLNLQWRVLSQPFNASLDLSQDSVIRLWPVDNLEVSMEGKVLLDIVGNKIHVRNHGVVAAVDMFL